MKLSEHFDSTEFEKADDPIPKEAMPAFEYLCKEILEKARNHFDKPFITTSGYRSSAHNAAVGGVPTSQHVATADHCAVDFQVKDTDPADVFDWMRSQPLPFDQLILEYGAVKDSTGDDCIHVSWRKNPRRQAKIGATHNRSRYVSVEVAPLNPSVG